MIFALEKYDEDFLSFLNINSIIPFFANLVLTTEHLFTLAIDSYFVFPRNLLN